MRKQKISLVINAIVVVLEIIATAMSVQSYGAGMFEFYAIDSNLLGMVACAIMACYSVRALRGGKGIPAWALVLKYVAACCLTLTFFVVVLVLVPMFGPQGAYGMLLYGPMPSHHLICPILTFVSFVFFEADASFGKKNALYAMIPTVIYAAVLISLNIARVVEGPYPFLHVYEQPVFMSLIWVVLIVGGFYLLARGIIWLAWKASSAKRGKAAGRGDA